ncbi:MAG: DUF2341 domain-containing protein, partial [Candidatus Andersenbacteria bacterium]|nr:DUF2341 domain-containing protein [Candidatus Andersenbacteria bacterium]
VTYPFTKSDAAKYDTTGRVTFNKTHAAPDWYHADWPYRQKITVNHEQVAGALSAFPMLVKMTGEIVSKAQADGDDILFTSDDGATKLYHEIESFDGELVAWVQVPELSEREDTILYVYYGNPKAENQQSTTRVWDTNTYAGVWHLNDGARGTQQDSTSGNNDGTPVNIDFQEAETAGKISGAINLDGNNDHILIANESNFDLTSAVTVSAWVKVDAFSGSWRGIFTKGDDTWRLARHGSTDNIGFGSDHTGVGDHNLRHTGNNANDGQWHYLVGVFGGGEKSVYVDGSLGETATGLNNIPSDNYAVWIGGNSNQGRYWNGQIDEVRASSVARSGAWITTEYKNQSKREDFLAIDPVVESYTDTPTLTLDAKQALDFQSLSVFTPNGSGELTWQLSPDSGTTWYFVKDGVWKQANPDNADHRSTGEAMNDHLTSFPQGAGKLLWRAYFEEATATMDGLKIDYTMGAVKGAQTSGISSAVFALSSNLAQSINSLFSLAHSRVPTFSEWQYWADRVMAGDKDGQPALLGAMQWQRLFGGGTAGTAQVAGITTAGPTIEIRNGTNEQGLARRTLGKLTEQGYAVTEAANAQDFLRETSKVYVIDHEAYGTARELADSLAIPVGLDLPAGEEPSDADILLILGYD